MTRRKYRRKRNDSLLDSIIDDILSPSQKLTYNRKKKPEPIMAIAGAAVMFLVISSLKFDGTGVMLDFLVFFSRLLTIVLWMTGIVALLFILSKLVAKIRLGWDTDNEEAVQAPLISEGMAVEGNETTSEQSEPWQITESEGTKSVQIYNPVGSLTELLSRLRENGINCFSTLEDIRIFRNEYKDSIEKIKEKNREVLAEVISNLEKEREESTKYLTDMMTVREQELKEELSEFETQLASFEHPKSLLEKISFFFKKRDILSRKPLLEHSFDEELKRPFKRLIDKIEHLESEIANRKENTDKWLESFSAEEIQKQEHILSVFVENKSLFYGAEGEERAVNELKKLPNTYTVINDYRLQFVKPIYDRRNDDRIYSIQIDHVVVGPTGIYLIETKNWSKDSVQNFDLFSPIKQLKRHSFVMFVLLNQAIEGGGLHTFSNHWGERKISTKNIVLLMSHKPEDEFQYVKVLTIDEIRDYILKEKPVFAQNEVQALIEYLDYIED